MFLAVYKCADRDVFPAPVVWSVYALCTSQPSRWQQRARDLFIRLPAIKKRQAAELWCTEELVVIIEELEKENPVESRISSITKSHKDTMMLQGRFTFLPPTGLKNSLLKSVG